MTPKATLTRNNNARTPKAAPSRVPTPTLRRLKANALGKRVGLVTTAEIHDASPAAFSVHTRNRGNYADIVDQYLALEPDVMLGGGSDQFLPEGPSGGKRKDQRDVLAGG